ncbi:uncharacterized protein BDV17DRAFT_289083 [Aspergillus undulatus]|uniref:uncharacterized protein n=1 Tax=Aspergillus undulatus TaxID=1810928 RepID=UPI003CCD3DB6
MTATDTHVPGQRLLATVVDNLAISNSTQRLGVIPSNNDFKTVAAKELSDAVNATARWIERRMGRHRNQTLTFMGANDIQYIVFVFASHKMGYKQRRVFEIQGFRQGTDFFEVSRVEDIIKAHEAVSYPWARGYTECEDEVALIVHSSGTTDRQSTLFNDLGPDHLVLSSTPSFYLMGFLSFTESIFHNVPFVNLPDKPLSVDLLADTVRKTKPTAAMLPPSILEDMSHTEAGIETLKTLDYVYYAGAPLATDTGNYLSNYTKIITVLDSSEMGIICSFVPHGEGNWMYFEWNDAYGVKMEDAGEGEYELVIPRREGSRKIYGIFHTFPHKSDYHSNDLFVQHPDNPKLWKYHGRRDEVIVLSNGEKLNPVTLKKIIEGHPRVQRAVLIGQSRFQTSLVVQPNWPATGASFDEAAFMDQIWPVVEKANQAVPSYGRILKNKIRLASPGRPFKTTPNGSTQRHVTNNDYKDEIEAIYSVAEQEQESDVQLHATLDMDNMTAFVRQTIRSLLKREDINDDDDLYTAGLDSLQTIQLSRVFKTAFSFQEQHAQPITAEHMYANPTVSRLAQFLLAVLTGQTTTSNSGIDRINNMVLKYTANLPQRSQRQAQRLRSGPQTVILTGATGFLSPV